MFCLLYGLIWFFWFFFGYRIVGPKRFKRWFCDKSDNQPFFYCYNRYLYNAAGEIYAPINSNRKVWNIIKDKDGNEILQKIPLSLFELSIIVVILMFIVFVLPEINISTLMVDETLLIMLSSIAGISVLLFIIMMYVKNLFNFKTNVQEYNKNRKFKKEDRIKEKEKKEENRIVLARSAYENWLGEHMNRKQKTESVDIRHLPPPPQKTERIIRAFRVTFWAAKAKVCKPYEK